MSIFLFFVFLKKIQEKSCREDPVSAIREDRNLAPALHGVGALPLTEVSDSVDN